MRAAPLVVNRRNFKSSALGGALVVVAIVLASTVSTPKARANPTFARQTGKPCNFCHQGVPRLNDTGLAFKANGFALPDSGKAPDGERKDAPAH